MNDNKKAKKNSHSLVINSNHLTSLVNKNVVGEKLEC